MFESSALHILVIENNNADAAFIKTILKEIPNTVIKISIEKKIDSAVKYIQKNQDTLDLIIMDIFFPDIEYPFSLKKVTDEFPDMPIVVITKHKNEKQALDALSFGAQDYLLKKHIEKSLLIKTLYYAIEKQKLRKQLNLHRKFLNDTEQNFRNLISENQDSIIVINEQGLIQFVNSAAEKMFGRNMIELMDNHFGIPVISNETIPVSIVKIQDIPAIAEMKVFQIPWQSSNAYMCIFTEENKKVVSAAGQSGGLHAAREELNALSDELESRKQKLVEIERLHSVKELTYIIAHEYSQPLQALYNYLHLLETKDQKGEYLKKSREMLKRVSELTDTLKNLTSTPKEDFFQTQLKKNLSPAQHLRKGKRILVVDDEREILETLIDIFRNAGYECQGVDNGIKALNLLKKEPVDLIISDVIMPEMHGTELFNNVKKLNLNAHFIFLTGYDLSSDLKETLKMADFTIPKPVSFEQLIKYVDHILS